MLDSNPKSFPRCGKVVEGGEQRWRKVCRGRSSDQLVNIKPCLDICDKNPFCERLDCSSTTSLTFGEPTENGWRVEVGA